MSTALCCLKELRGPDCHEGFVYEAIQLAIETGTDRTFHLVLKLLKGAMETLNAVEMENGFALVYG